MRGLRHLTFVVTTLIVGALLIAFTPAAFAEDEHTFIGELNRIRDQMRELAVEARNYQLQKKYCLPPYAPLKQPDQMMIDGFKARAEALNREYNATIGSLISFFETNTAIREQRMLEDGIDRRDPRHWEGLPHNQTRKWMNKTVNDKAEALAKKKERNCAPPATGPIGVIGTEPPPPPPPPPPLPPVDPLKGLRRPTFTAATPPLIQDHYCSQAEKSAALAKIPVEIAKVQAQISSIDAYIAAVIARRGELEKRGVESHWLDSMDYERRQAEQMRDDRRTTIESLNSTRRLIEQTPVVDCSRKEVGQIPGATSVGFEAGYVDLRFPKKPYLALEYGSELHLGAVHLERDDTTSQGTLFLEHDFTCDRLPTLTIGNPRESRWMTVAELSRHMSRYASRDGSLTTVNEGLGIPGTGDPMSVYPAGVFLSDPAYNDVTDIRYAHESEYQRASIGLGQKARYGNWQTTLGLDFEYSNLESRDLFSASVPGYLTDFRYRTDIETNNFAIFVRGGVEIALDHQWAKSIRYAGELAGFSISAEVKGGINFLDADGIDRLDLSGYLNDAQRVDISKDDTTFSYRLSGALNYTPPAAQSMRLSLGIEYGESDTHPVASRSGETGERTQIIFGTQEEMLGTLRTRFSF